MCGVKRGHEDVRLIGEGRERRFFGHAEHDVEDLVDELVGFPHHHRVDERRERQRIAERERPAGEHERVLGVAVLGKRRHTRELQHFKQAGELRLVRDRKRDHRVVGHGAELLVGDGRHASALPGAHVVGKERAVGGAAGRAVDGPIERLIAERRHADPIGAWIHERD